MFEGMFHVGGGGEGREIKPHPQPLPEEGGEWLVMEMEKIVLRLNRSVPIVDNKA